MVHVTRSVREIPCPNKRCGVFRNVIIEDGKASTMGSEKPSLKVHLVPIPKVRNDSGAEANNAFAIFYLSVTNNTLWSNIRIVPLCQIRVSLLDAQKNALESKGSLCEVPMTRQI